MAAKQWALNDIVMPEDANRWEAAMEIAAGAITGVKIEDEITLTAEGWTQIDVETAVNVFGREDYEGRYMQRWPQSGLDARIKEIQLADLGIRDAEESIEAANMTGSIRPWTFNGYMYFVAFEAPSANIAIDLLKLEVH